MKEIIIEYELSVYSSLATLSESSKTRVEIVRSSYDGIIYIKKTMRNYNIEVFKILKAVNSINLPKIHKIIEFNEELIIIEEFINGQNLEDLLINNGLLDEDKVIDYMIKLCDALAKIHFLEKPVIHRDIKPSNILIDSYGVIKLIDFDASRVYKSDATKDTEVLGTHGYAAPEQFVSLQTDGRSDIYSLGVLFNMLIVGKDPRVEITSGKGQSIIEKCINLDPKNRYQSVIELKIALESLIGNKEKVEKKEAYRKEIVDIKVVEKKSIDSESFKIYKKLNSKFKKIIREIPGFRKGKKLNKIVATLFYLFSLTGILVAEGNMKIMLENSIVIGMLLTYWLLGTNFKNITSKLPLLKSKSFIKKIIGYIIYSFVIFLTFSLTLSSVMG